MKAPKSVVLDLLQQELKTNNLISARFESLSNNELEREYCQSGKVCKQVLEDYKKRRVEIENAIIWIKNI